MEWTTSKKIFLSVIHMNAKCITSTKDYWSLYLIIQTPYAVSAILFLDNLFCWYWPPCL